MSVSSMTGFSAREGACGAARWIWELRAVNGRGLDLKIRLPPGSERLEPEIRTALGAAFARGSISASLVVKQGMPALELKLNEPILEQLLTATTAVARRHGAPAPQVEALLSVRGVVEVVEAEPADTDGAFRESVLQGLKEAVAQLAAARRSEGERLRTVLRGQLDEIERLATTAQDAQAARSDRIRARLTAAIAALLDTAAPLDPDRLHQEAVLLAAKADVREEIDRLQSHVAAARGLLEEGGPVGRRLDFLSQELNREANTLCAKSVDPALTTVGLGLKAAIDQFREQVQNIE